MLGRSDVRNAGILIMPLAIPDSRLRGNDDAQHLENQTLPLA